MDKIRKQLNIQLDYEFYDLFKKVCENNGVSPSKMAELILVDYISSCLKGESFKREKVGN